jgi:UPF0755 protein
MIIRRLARYFLIFALCLLATVLLLSLIFGRSLIRSLAGENSFLSRLDNLLKQEEQVSTVLRPEKTVRFVEGWTNRDMGQYLEGQGIWQSEELLESAGFPQVDYSLETDMPLPLDFSQQYNFLQDKPLSRGLEGYLYPDTYRIYAASSTPADLIVKMLSNFDQKLTAQMRADIKKQGKTIYEIVTMASILEKEAPINYASGDNRDARIIAGIFWDRIKVGQALQSCASLAYILGVNKSQYSAADTQIESPYNTYKYRGLPPGPISNPGILAIEAAIYPLSTNYNYFLTPSGSKEIIYAATYEEHLRNKNKYLP